jgi:hypothetical protein
MRRLPDGVEARVVARIREGATAQAIAGELGCSESCVRYLAVKHRLVLCSRYRRKRAGEYWARQLGHARPRAECGKGRRLWTDEFS